jgi:hypothetical protein
MCFHIDREVVSEENRVLPHREEVSEENGVKDLGEEITARWGMMLHSPFRNTVRAQGLVGFETPDDVMNIDRVG